MKKSERQWILPKLLFLYLLLMSVFQTSTTIHGDSQYALSTFDIISYEIVDHQTQLIIDHEIIDTDTSGDAKYHISETPTGQWTTPIGIGEHLSPDFYGRPTFLGDTTSNGTYKIYLLHESMIYRQEYLPDQNQWKSPEAVINKSTISKYLPMQYRNKGIDWEPSIRPIVFQINENNTLTFGWSFSNRNFEDDFNNKPFICTFNMAGSVSFESELKNTKFLYEYKADSFFFDFNNRLSFYEGYYRNYYTYKNNEWIVIDEIKEINSRIRRVSKLDGNIIESHQIEDSGSINSHWIHKEVVLRVISSKSMIHNISIPFDPADLRYYEISNIISHESAYYVSTYDRAKFQILRIDLNRSTVNILNEYQYVDDAYDYHRYPQQLELISREYGLEIYWSEDVFDSTKDRQWSEIFRIGFNLDHESWTQITQITDGSLFTNDYVPYPNANRINFGWISFYSSLFLLIYVRKKKSIREV